VSSVMKVMKVMKVIKVMSVMEGDEGTPRYRRAIAARSWPLVLEGT
jgi:hypothetical protein